MRHLRSTLAATGIGIVGALLFAACSSSGGSSATTTAPSTLPTTTVPASSPAPATSAPATTAAPTTVVTATTAAPTTTAGPTTTAPTGPKLYSVVPAPKVPTTHTDPFPATGALKNGVYWTQLVGGDAKGPSITIVQAFFGKECQSKATEMGDECLNDIYILSTPSRDEAGLKFAPGVTITVADPNTMQSMWITTDELVFLRTSGPTGGAPKNYAYAPFSYLMTVKSGAITRFEQVWTP
jgi:hypothetical protein